MKLIRHIIGLLFAPVIALLFVHLTFVFIFWLDNENLWWPLISTYEFGIPYAYGITVIVGVPLYLILYKFKYTRLWHLVVAGACMYVVPFTIITILAGRYPWHANRPSDGIALLLSGGIGGAIIGLLFWFIALYQIKINLTSRTS